MRVEVQCACGAVSSINKASLRINLKRNGAYRCYTCSKADMRKHVSEALLATSSGDKRKIKVPITCSTCDRVFMISAHAARTNVEKHGVYTCSPCITNRNRSVHRDQWCDAPGKRYAVACTCGKAGTLTYNRWRRSIRNGGYVCRSCSNHKAATSGQSYGTKGQRKVLIPAAVQMVPVVCSKCKHEYSLQHATILKMKGAPVVCRSCAFDDRISNLEIGVMRLLDGLQIKYTHHWRHWYEFDLLVGDNLIVEAQGEYWHNRGVQKSLDARKYEYVKEMLPEYRIAYVWENELKEPEVLKRRLLSLAGRGTDKPVLLADVTVREVVRDEVRSFLDAYHYLGMRRWGKAWGAFHNGELIAACLFTSAIRQNQDYGGDFVVLDRFCVHPDVRCDNLASWFISRCLRLVGKKVVTFADTTEGHAGTIYKACNFEFSHEVKPDYWYVDLQGKRIHKKTVWNQSRRSDLTEDGYATAADLEKVWGEKKLCFVFSPR